MGWVLKKLNTELPYDPSIPLLILQKVESRDTVTFTPVFIVILFPIAKRWKQPK